MERDRPPGQIGDTGESVNDVDDVDDDFLVKKEILQNIFVK